MRVPKPPKSTLRKMMEEEEYMSKAAGCPPGHTYNPVVKKCLPGSPLSGIGDVYTQGQKDMVQMETDMKVDAVKQLNAGAGMGNSPKKSAPKKSSPNAKIAAEAYQRASQGLQ